MTATFAPRIADIPRARWNALAGTYNPFISHEFLDALEASGSVGEGTGWRPHHLQIHDKNQKLTGLCPLYLKAHSMGEYVFDQSWAEAFREAGGRYYPKLLSAIPFTPVSAPKLLGDKKALIPALKHETQSRGLSSAHVLFIEKGDQELFQGQGFLIRNDQQFHWHNKGYDNFAEFLKDLKSGKRKTIKKERRSLQKSGLEIAWKSGDELSGADWDFFYRCYSETCIKRWGRAYLNREFFSLLGQKIGPSIRLCVASLEGVPVAAALHILGKKRLFGRYWGALSWKKFLHFELCYYQAIELAIREGLDVIEAGAQGGHKLLRGYQPVTTASAHWISHPGFREAVGDFLKRERQMVKAENRRLKGLMPFRKA